jgi:hypothetical protein
VTGPRGGFTFDQLPAGDYTLAASRPGEQAAIASASVAPGQRIVRILQLPPPQEARSFSTFQGFNGHAELTQPGMACRSCSWTAELQGHPGKVRVDARWDDVGPERALRLELRTDAGELLDRYAGPSPATLEADGVDIPVEARGVRFDVYVGGDVLAPRLDMESVLGIDYPGA